jgi:uncharacterized protein
LLSHFRDMLGLQIKPVGPNCNISCDYCYVNPFKGGKFEKMSDEVLEAAISSLLHISGHPTISWHGGEPMLAGLSFYKKAATLIQRHKHGKVVRNQIQTNATLVTPEFAAYFKANNFSVGVSLDGPRETHDAHRRDHAGRGTFDRVMRGVAILRDANVDPAVTATVSKDNVNSIVETYDFLVAEGFRQIRFSPVFVADESTFGIEPEDWGDALVRVFDRWFDKEDSDIHVRDIEQVLAWTLEEPIALCNGNHGCLNWVSVAPNGDLYPCEYFRGDYSYGNILTHGLGEIEETKEFDNYRKMLTTPPQECSSCRFIRFCGNGCSGTRVTNGESDPRGVDAFCASKKILFEHIERVLAEIQ